MDKMDKGTNRNALIFRYGDNTNNKCLISSKDKDVNNILFTIRDIGILNHNQLDIIEEKLNEQDKMHIIQLYNFMLKYIIESLHEILT